MEQIQLPRLLYFIPEWKIIMLRYQNFFRYWEILTEL
jgi:hypothetical protein